MQSKRLLIKALGASALLPAVAVSSHARTRQAPEKEQYFPDAIVETHDGRKVRFYQDIVKDKIVIFNMMYTVCTNICPPNTANLLTVQNALGERVGRDLFMYSISLQPEIDTPAALRDYANKYGVKPGWTFLRLKRQDLEIIRRKLGFFNTDPVADADISKHTGMIRVGNERLDRWFMAPSIAPARQIVKSIQNV